MLQVVLVQAEQDVDARRLDVGIDHAYPAPLNGEQGGDVRGGVRLARATPERVDRHDHGISFWGRASAESTALRHARDTTHHGVDQPPLRLHRGDTASCCCGWGTPRSGRGLQLGRRVDGQGELAASQIVPQPTRIAACPDEAEHGAVGDERLTVEPGETACPGCRNDPVAEMAPQATPLVAVLDGEGNLGRA